MRWRRQHGLQDLPALFGKGGELITDVHVSRHHKGDGGSEARFLEASRSMENRTGGLEQGQPMLLEEVSGGSGVVGV